MLGLGNSICDASYAGGKYSNFSGSFDGTADFVLLSKTAALAPAAAVSLSFWMKPNAWDMPSGADQDTMLGCKRTGGWEVYLANSHPGDATTLNFLIYVTDTGSGSSGAITATLNEATTEALTGWHHVVATYDGTTAKLYIDGGTTGVTNATSASGTTINYHSTSSRPLVLGADVAGSTTAQNFYHGLLDEVAVFNSALSSGNVTSIYNSGAPNDISGMSNLVGYWRFEEGTGNAVADDSSNSNNGGLGNAWTWSEDTPG